MSSIFKRLYKFRPSGERQFRENFFTEAFVGVLRKSDSLRVAYVKWLVCEDTDHVDIETQWTIDDGGIPDIWIEAQSILNGTRHVVAMENKIDAGVDSSQLRRYEEELRRDEAADTRTLVSATVYGRSGFQCSVEEPRVEFHQVHWFQVADWLRDWVDRQSGCRGDPNALFVRELILLMEDWNMAINLNIDDLATATAYHTSVATQFVQILNLIYAACNVPGTRRNPWRYEPLWYSSPWIDDQHNFYVKFGFDFTRSDPSWTVSDLRLPSAYFAVRGEHRPEIDNLPIGWQPPPDGWHADNLRVKQLDSLQIPGEPLHLQYLAFFENARAELWQTVGLVP